ncbi:MAG: hypothetical protein HGA36_02175 [Candidatus Moranbacteria bacterium]|nr:hypothetical protein [Candidatus Moranbacteria bacterium]
MKKAQKILISLAPVIIFVVFSFIITQKAQAAADATIYINPATISANAGSDFSVDVLINPLDHYVTNADLYFTYDQSKFTLTSITASATFNTPLGQSVPVTPDGTGSYSASTTFGAHISAITTYATLNFHAVAAVTDSPITITNSTMVYADNSPTYPADAGTNVVGTRTSGAVTVTILDVTPPVISAATPVTNASIKSIAVGSAVSYSLSESIASGTIVFTRTGGVADGAIHTCTLQAAARTTGAHNNLDLSNTTNSCTSAQSLVSGAIYSVAFNAIDLAGNPAVQVLNTGITFDNVSPVISSATPATNANIKSIAAGSAVSYSLSEAIASGTIVFTRTGGVADGAAHSCALKGTALNTGAHSNIDLSDTTNTCAVAQSLVSGTIYTIAFNATDLAGNSAVQILNTGVTFDSTPPVGVLISYTDGFLAAKSFALVTNDGTDNIGVNAGNRILQRRAATPVGGVCGAFGLWSTITPSGTYPNIFDTTMAERTCYQYQFIISDLAGNQTIQTSTNTIKSSYRADINNNGSVLGDDFSTLHNNYDTVNDRPGDVADITGDNKVNGADFSILHNEYGNTF